MVEWKQATLSGKPLGSRAEPGFNFKGGKQDDITVTVAQFFIAETDPKKKDPMRKLAAEDKHFKAAKTVYKEPISADKLMSKAGEAAAKILGEQPPAVDGT